MDADLDLLLTVVYCMTDDFLPQRAGNARRRITDAEIITLCLAQAIMGLPSDERFLAVARHRLVHLFPDLPAREAFHKRRLRVSGQIEALIAQFVDVDDLGAVRGRGPHTELGLSLLRCPADETRQASRPPSGSSDPRCCDEKGVTACAGRSDARIARIPHRPTGRSASTARVGAGMRAGNGADVVDLEQPSGSISPRGGHERRAAGATATARG